MDPDSIPPLFWCRDIQASSRFFNFFGHLWNCTRWSSFQCRLYGKFNFDPSSPFVWLMGWYVIYIGFVRHLGTNHSLCWKSANYSPGSYIWCESSNNRVERDINIYIPIYSVFLVPGLIHWRPGVCWDLVASCWRLVSSPTICLRKDLEKWFFVSAASYVNLKTRKERCR